MQDTGPGLGATHAERVFERFYRSDKSRTRASGGAGLGLSIVAAVAEAHGGRVAAVAHEGAGATFRITIPAVPANDLAARHHGGASQRRRGRGVRAGSLA